MGFLSKLRYWYDPLGFVLARVQQWQPRDCKSERDYQTSLSHFLKQRLESEGIDVTRQHGSGRIRGDIVVGRKVLVELKVNLDSMAKLRDLLGQLELYSQEWKRHVIFVVCGENDRDLLRRFQQTVQKYNPFEDRLYAVMEK